MILINNQIPVILPTAEVTDWLARNIDPSEIYLWDARAWPGPGLSQLAWPTGFRPLPPVRVGEFHWPTGASRWGYLHVLADSQLTGPIREAAFGKDGTRSNAIQVYLDTADAVAAGQGNIFAKSYISTFMYMLPPYTLGRVPPIGDQSFNGLFLLTFVDARFYWQGVPAPSFNIGDNQQNSSGSVGWEDCLGTFQNAAIGLDNFRWDPVPKEYLKPSPSLNVEGESLPYVMDIVAANVGQRIVKYYGGLVYSMTAATALQLRQQDDQSDMTRSVRAGNGDRFLDTL